MDWIENILDEIINIMKNLSGVKVLLSLEIFNDILIVGSKIFLFM